MASRPAPTVLLVPGLRDQVDAHWQTWLQAQLPGCRSVPPMGRDDLDCARRIDAIEQAVQAIDGPLLLVAHSAGCIMVAHWVRRSPGAADGRVVGVLLATPPDFERPMPAGYPTTAQLQQGGWLPVPRTRLPFRSLVALSHDDLLASADRVRALAADWGSTVADQGAVGHLNPASGHGPWPAALDFIAQLSA
jgi:predicted alpha/beta hydrolase family esterase